MMPESVLVDEHMLPVIANREWSIIDDNGNSYAIDRSDMTRMHRLILACDNLVDHVNGNGLDNRLVNLRCSTPSENSRNRRSVRNTRSIYKGIYYDSKKSVWRARVQIDSKSFYNGSHKTEEEAARAYDELARIHYGAFAAVNFPEEGETSALR